jgi:hypothetical protein
MAPDVITFVIAYLWVERHRAPRQQRSAPASFRIWGSFAQAGINHQMPSSNVLTKELLKSNL